MSTLNVDKVDPSTGTALEIGTSGDTITVPSGATFVVAGTTEITGTNNVQRPNAQPLIINGNCAISQRSTSVAGVGDGDTGFHTLDRWRFSEGGTPSTEFTMSQSTDVPSGYGFSNSLKMDCTTADASLNASDSMMLQQRFEGQNLQLLKKGTSNAEKITVAFWVKSTVTGTYILELQDSDNIRNISKTYTISSADTWEKKVVNFDGDTTGALGNDNGNSFEINWWLQSGTDFATGSLQTSWGARTTDARATGQVNTGSSTSNDFLFTAVQLEVGEFNSTTLPPFQHESYGDNLARCQRYFTQFGKNQGVTVGSSKTYGMGITNNDDLNSFVHIALPTTMRTIPTSITQTGTASDYNIRAVSTDACTGVPTFHSATPDAIILGFVNSVHSFGSGVVIRGQTNADDSFIGVDIEL